MATNTKTIEVQRLTSGAYVVQRVYGDVFALDGSYRVERISGQYRTRREAQRMAVEVAS